MNAFEILLILLALAVLVLFASKGKQQRGLIGCKPDEQQRELLGCVPDELKNTFLFMNEKAMRITRPINLSFKPDEVYELGDGSLVVVETKTHRRVFKSDVVQLSAYKLGLEEGLGRKVASHAYVRLTGQQGTTPTYKKVELYSTQEVLAIHQRRNAILSGDIEPQKSCSTGLCEKCAYKTVC